MEMPNADLRKPHDDFNRALGDCRDLLEWIIGLGDTAGNAKQEILAELLVVRIVALWERYGEDTMVTCVHNAPHLVTKESDNDPATPPSMKECRDFILDKCRSGCLRCNDTTALISMSERFLPSKRNPFPILEKHGLSIKTIYSFRNYLAHYSTPSRENLEETYEKRYGCKEWTEPGRFLLRDNGRELRRFLTKFENISQDMRIQIQKLYERENGAP